MSGTLCIHESILQDITEGKRKHFKTSFICVLVGYVRRDHLRLFLSFFLLLIPALDGESSFSLAWLDILEELCWLK